MGQQQSKIRLFRHLQGLAQWQLARRVGCSQPYMSWIERGLIEPSPELLKRIEAELNVSLAEQRDEGRDEAQP